MKTFWERYGKLVVEVTPDMVIRHSDGTVELTEEGKEEVIKAVKRQVAPFTLFTISQILVVFALLFVAWGLSLWLVILWVS